MKRFLLKSLPFAALLLGVVLLLYPTVSEHINAMHQSRAIQAYNRIAESMSDEQHDQLIGLQTTITADLPPHRVHFFIPSLWRATTTLLTLPERA